jgi:CYTH domain-containing protein
VRRWDIPSGTRWLEEGLWTSYDQARRGLRRARRKPTDDRLHEWRKAVKTLWYQLRLVEGAAPSVLASLVTQLHDLAEALGDDHDLSVLIARLEADPKGFGGTKQVKRAVKQARAEQDDLRRRSFRLGTTLFTEPTDAFVHRVAAYWRTAIEAGPELATGGIAELVADEQRAAREPMPSESGPDHHIERERKFVVDTLPPLPDNGLELRQGYLAIDGTVSLRVRKGGPHGSTLTVKAGRGSVRTELEWPISTDQFEAAWAHTETRRVRKTRYQIDLVGSQPGGTSSTADVDVFHDELDGLVVAEVEFSSDEAMSAFMPPAWFGREVTDDPAYTNASLAVNGWQPR